jgi:hypothetical protein
MRAGQNIDECARFRRLRLAAGSRARDAELARHGREGPHVSGEVKLEKPGGLMDGDED